MKDLDDAVEALHETYARAEEYKRGVVAQLLRELNEAGVENIYDREGSPLGRAIRLARGTFRVPVEPECLGTNVRADRPVCPVCHRKVDLTVSVEGNMAWVRRHLA